MANNNNNHSNEFLFSEAPASWNTRYVDPNGFECQLTLRAETGQELLEKVDGAITYLQKNGCQPYHYKVGYQGGKNKSMKSKGNGKKANGNQPDDNPAWCPVHQCEMKRWEKEGRVWYSHKVNDGWCKGK